MDEIKSPLSAIFEKRIAISIITLFLLLVSLSGQTNDTLIFKPAEPYPSFSYKGINETGEACKLYFAQHLIIPKELMDDGIYGAIYIQFIVEKNGKLSDIKLLRGVHPVLDEMALNVTRKMPRWKPAKKNGKSTRTFFAVAVKWGYPGIE